MTKIATSAPLTIHHLHFPHTKFSELGIAAASQAVHGLQNPNVTAHLSDDIHRPRERYTMIMIFDGLYADTYLAVLGLTLATQKSDYSEFDKEPINATSLWTSIAAAGRDFWKARRESEFGFPSDY